MPPEPTVVVDLSPIVQSLIGLAAAVVSGLIPYITYRISRHFNVSADSDAIKRINLAAENAAGRIFEQLSRTPVTATLPPTAAMVANEAVKVASLAQESAARLGVDNQRIAEIVRGKLGQLIASDPTIRTGLST